MNNKGQMTLGDAPSVVLIVGFVFLIMATMAYIAVSMGDSFASPTTATRTGESVTATTAGTSLSVGSLLNPVCTITTVVNSTQTLVSSGNYTATNCVIANTTGEFIQPFTVNYTVTYDDSVATNVTNDLGSNISSNTSIAGIVLTISLVGIVLTVLIGIFVIARNRGM